jgi:hypothetical protein
MIGIGINENVYITAAGINEKNRLYVELKEVGTAEDKASNPFEESLTASSSMEGNGGKFTYTWLSILTPKKEDQTREQKVTLIGADIKRFRNSLTHILEQYMLFDDIDLSKFDVQYANTGITDGDSYTARILDQDVLDKIYINISRRFVELIQPYLGNPELALRWKFPRQSKDKAYAALPKYFGADSPFVELMTVPKESSKIKWSAYEKKEGLDSAEPVSQATAEPKKAELEENPFAPR